MARKHLSWLLPLLALAGVALPRACSDATGADDIAFGSAAIKAMDVSALARGFNLTATQLLGMLDAEKGELGVHKDSQSLVYACKSLMVKEPKRRSLLAAGDDHELHLGHGNNHHSNHHGVHVGSGHRHLHGHSHHLQDARRALPRAQDVGGPQRQLLQVIRSDWDDPLPSRLPASASGVPLLHSRPKATRKIFLDFDGHNTRCARRPAAHRLAGLVLFTCLAAVLHAAERKEAPL